MRVGSREETARRNGEIKEIKNLKSDRYAANRSDRRGVGRVGVAQDEAGADGLVTEGGLFVGQIRQNLRQTGKDNGYVSPLANLMLDCGGYGDEVGAVGGLRLVNGDHQPRRCAAFQHVFERKLCFVKAHVDASETNLGVYREAIERASGVCSSFARHSHNPSDAVSSMTAHLRWQLLSPSTVNITVFSVLRASNNHDATWHARTAVQVFSKLRMTVLRPMRSPAVGLNGFG